jgi:hypothetical protein
VNLIIAALVALVIIVLVVLVWAGRHQPTELRLTLKLWRLLHLELKAKSRERK